MRLMRGLFRVAVGSLLASLPTVAAEAGPAVQADLVAQGSAVLEATAFTEAAAFGFVHDGRLAAAEAELWLAVETGSVRAVNFPQLVVRNGDSETRIVLPVEPVGEWQAPAVVELQAPAPRQSLRLLPLGGDDALPMVLPTGPVEFGPAVDWSSLLGRSEAFGQEGIHHPLWPKAGMVLSRPGWTGGVDAFAFLDGGLFTVAASETTTTVQTGARSLGGEGQPVSREDHVVLISEGRMQVVLASAGPAEAWRAAVATWEGEVSRMELQGVQGSLRWGHSSWTPDAALLAVGGDAVVRMSDPSSQGVAWTIRGSATSVGFDGHALSPGGPGDVVVVAAGVVSLASVLLVLVRFGKEVLAVFGRNIAQPMENERRRQVLRAVASNPGWGRMELARSLGLARTTVMHHLRVLKRAALIEERRTSKSPGYFLNSGSYSFAVPASSPVEAPLDVQKALLLLAQPTRRTIASLVKQRPASLEEMADQWPGRRPAPQTLSYHCRILWKAGLLDREGGSADVRWRLLFDANAVGAHQRRALLLQWRALPLYETLAAKGPARPEQLAALLEDRPAAVRDLLERLGAIGLVQAMEDDRYFVPAGMAAA